MKIARVLLVIVFCVLSTAALKRSSEGLDALRKAAEAGDDRAQLRLGNAYYFGRLGAKVDYNSAFKWYKRSAEAANPSAVFNLGLCYDLGCGTEKDRFKAFECYKEAAAAEMPQAKYNLALLYAKGLRGDDGRSVLLARDAVLAEKLLKELCAGNFVPACRELAKLYLDSSDKSAHAKGLPLLRKAAEAGDAIAMNLLSDFIVRRERNGTSSEDAEAVKWLRKAAKGGSVEAIAKLAYRYENGKGVEKNSKKAFEYYNMAAGAGLPMAQSKLGDFFAFGYPGVERDIPEAKKWYARAALGKNAKALFYLGTFALQGIGEKRDVVKAAKLFILGARMGEPHAQYNLAKFHLKGEGVPKDLAVAAYWFRKAALQGDPKAQRELAFCLIQGKGIK
ncbi:MAG: sel1 repeat family protein, partial [Victivallales bacterium]|nr:sel1 repeat family protein [Victivallales bacterium]